MLDKATAYKERLWYAQQTIANGWSRAVLEHQIETKLYQRQGKAITNFDLTLPQPQSDLAQQLIKDLIVSSNVLTSFKNQRTVSQ